MRCFLQLCFWSLLFIIRFRLFRPPWMSGATAWAIWYVAAVTSVPPSLPCPCVKLPPSARAGRVSVGKPLWCGAAATAADASVTAIGVDAGGAAKCAQRARVAHEGRDFKIKATRTASRRLDFPLKGKSEAANRSPVRIHGRDAGRAALPGPFTSVLKKQEGGRKKK